MSDTTSTSQPTLHEPPVAGSEVETLVGSLERQRATFRWKAGDLDATGLRATVGTSSMTLAGLLKHLALVEAHYFTHRLHGRDPGAPWNEVDWDADPDWEWRTATQDDPAELYALYDRSVAQARTDLAEALAGGDAGAPIAQTWPDGRTPSVRRLLVDIVEEYARHTGHADLLRESVDGLVGEDAPRAGDA